MNENNTKQEGEGGPPWTSWTGNFPSCSSHTLLAELFKVPLRCYLLCALIMTHSLTQGRMGLYVHIELSHSMTIASLSLRVPCYSLFYLKTRIMSYLCIPRSCHMENAKFSWPLECMICLMSQTLNRLSRMNNWPVWMESETRFSFLYQDFCFLPVCQAFDPDSFSEPICLVQVQT